MHLLRYSIAVTFIVILPPVLLFWMVVHPFIHFWRRLGLRRTYGILVTAMALGGAALYAFRVRLLAVDFGDNHALMAAGFVCIASSMVLRVMVGRRISTRQIVGVPEIAPETHAGKLLTEGIYSRIRHPRYLQIVLGLAGGALIANYAGSYATAIIWVPGLWLIIRLEERELCERFGEEYQQYRKRVPAIFPRLKT